LRLSSLNACGRTVPCFGARPRWISAFSSFRPFYHPFPWVAVLVFPALKGGIAVLPLTPFSPHPTKCVCPSRNSLQVSIHIYVRPLRYLGSLYPFCFPTYLLGILLWIPFFFFFLRQSCFPLSPKLSDYPPRGPSSRLHHFPGKEISIPPGKPSPVREILWKTPSNTMPPLFVSRGR